MFKKKHGQEQRPTFADQLTRLTGLPVDVVEGLPEIELLGNKEAVIEHCQGVLEYNDKVIRLNTGKLNLKFTGRNLQLKSMTDSSVVVEGYFTSIEFTN